MTATRSRTFVVRRLGSTDRESLRKLVDSDPYVNAAIAARLDAGYTGRRAAGRGAPLDAGGEVIGVFDANSASGSSVSFGRDGLQAAWWRGPTVLVIGGDGDLWADVASQLGQRERGCSSIIGRADVVNSLWPALAWYWGPARLIRSAQPLLMTGERPPVTLDSQVRPAHPSELDCYLPAAEAMFAEELGLPPFTGAARRAYRQRLAEMIAARRVFVRLDRQGRVAFKAEIGIVSNATSQIQGVWVRPDLRGRGLGTAATATVLDYALRLTPTASLYVNDFNHAARRVYDRLGMRQVATVGTVMF